MIPKVRKEVEEIIKEYRLLCSVEDLDRNDVLSKNLWTHVSKYNVLSEEFIREFIGRLDSSCISKYQKLSEDFIIEMQEYNYFSWGKISSYQKLSEDFIRRFQVQLNWEMIVKFQKLSEEFIREFHDRMSWFLIFKYQKLSEEFIAEFIEKLVYEWTEEKFYEEIKGPKQYLYVSQYQKLSQKLIEDLNIKIDQWNWLYHSKEDKLKYIKENTNYEIVDDEYIIAYKSVRQDRYSVFNFQYQYFDGQTYSSHCNCNNDEKNSFGLSAWTIERAKEYYDDMYCNNGKAKILKVRIDIDNIGVIVHNNQKIRCFELTVLEEVKD